MIRLATVFSGIGAIKNNSFINSLPMDDKRAEYLRFHHQSVFKGSFDIEI